MWSHWPAWIWIACPGQSLSWICVTVTVVMIWIDEINNCQKKWTTVNYCLEKKQCLCECARIGRNLLCSFVKPYIRSLTRYAGACPLLNVHVDSRPPITWGNHFTDARVRKIVKSVKSLSMKDLEDKCTWRSWWYTAPEQTRAIEQRSLL